MQIEAAGGGPQKPFRQYIHPSVDFIIYNNTPLLVVQQRLDDYGTLITTYIDYISV